MKPYILPLADPNATLDVAGGKGASLSKLANAGLPVPGGFHVTTAAYKMFVAENGLQSRIMAALEAVDVAQPATLETASRTIHDHFAQATIPAAIAAAIRAAYSALSHSSLLTLNSQLAVAVRSSATAEDLPDLSFAGQQETFLNIQGADAVMDAVKRCWASLWTARAIGYRVRNAIDQESVSLAVVVQTLIPADVAGIMFTANPLNGRRDQAVINAAWGLGEAVVGGLVTPDTFTVDKAENTIVAREIADKQTMTVCIDGGTEERPVPAAQRHAPSLNDAQVAELAQLGTQIEALYGMPMDIEWALTFPSPGRRGGGGEVHILQARPITALPELELDPPAGWGPLAPKTIYMRNSIVELLPDPLSPLYATLGGRAVNAGTLQLFAEIVGRDMLPEEMFTTLNGYGYYKMQMTLKFWARALIRMWAFLPKMFQGETRWRDEAHPRYMDVIEKWQSRSLTEYTSAELLEGAYQLAAESANIYNVYQSGVIGQATMSEMLFTAFYEKLIRRKGEPPALTLMLGGDSLPLRTEKSLYDIGQWCRVHHKLAAYVTETPSERLVVQLDSESPPTGTAIADDVWQAWQRQIAKHLADYGYVVYDMDFAKPVPADAPAPILETLKLYVSGQGTDPHARQLEQLAQREAAIKALTARLKGRRLKWFRKLLGWVHKYVPMREDNLADVSLGYPLLRQMLHELGDRLTRVGTLEQADDVYWLTEDEATAVAAALDRGETPPPASETVRYRKAEWRVAKRVTPPATLPERSGMARYMEKLGPARMQQEDAGVIKGVGASPGQVTAKACVLHGPEDFSRMSPGEILVAAITTPAWTPLFAMAAGVVTDIGGPLSHGSIVAREYGIPAVLGTGIATRRIEDGQMITVDGSAGTVKLEAGG